MNLPPLNDHEIQAYHKLIRSISSQLVLALPHPSLLFVIDTNASDYQVETAQFHVYQDRERKPIGFWSFSFNAHENNYSVAKKW